MREEDQSRTSSSRRSATSSTRPPVSSRNGHASPRRLSRRACETPPLSPHLTRPSPRCGTLEIVGVHDYLALVVVVLQEARVLQQTLALEQPLSQEELTTVARRLNEPAGWDAPTAEIYQGEERLHLAPVEAAVRDATATPDRRYGRGRTSSLRSWKASVTCSASRSSTRGERVITLLELLENRNLARAIPVWGSRGKQEIKIIIGGEHPEDAMRTCSVITNALHRPVGPARQPQRSRTDAHGLPAGRFDGPLHALPDGGTPRRLLRVGGARWITDDTDEAQNFTDGYSLMDNDTTNPTLKGTRSRGR